MKCNANYAANSARGSAHIANGFPCQDYSFIENIDGENYLIALADGLGTALKSHIGAKIAVRYVARQLKKQFRLTNQIDENTVQDLFYQVNEHITRFAMRIKQPKRDFATTLQLAYISSKTTIIAAIGDGAIVYRMSPEEAYLLFVAEENEYANQTSTVFDVAALKTITLSGSPEFVLLSTDGMRSLLIDEKQQKPFIPAFNYLNEQLKSIPAKDVIASVFIDPEVKQRVDDDLSLAIYFKEVDNGLLR